MSTDNPLVAYPDPAMPNMLRIKYQNGHPPPQELSGNYTGFTMVQKAIKAHEASKPKPIKYKGTKTISAEEEAAIMAVVEEEVAKKNKELEAKTNGEEKTAESKDSVDAEHLREGSDNGSESSDVSGKRES